MDIQEEYKANILTKFASSTAKFIKTIKNRLSPEKEPVLVVPDVTFVRPQFTDKGPEISQDLLLVKQDFLLRLNFDVVVSENPIADKINYRQCLKNLKMKQKVLLK